MATAKIILPIQPRNYEVIRDQIGAIIAVELKSQASLVGDVNLDASVWVNRQITFDKAELPAINVSFIEGLYGNKHQGAKDGDYTFAIDVYTRSSGENADSKSANYCDRIAGIVDAILESPHYKTLGFPPPSISTSIVESIRRMDTNSEPNLENVAVIRLEFKVKVNEKVELQESIQLLSNDTKVLLHHTDKGYVYKIND